MQSLGISGEGELRGQPANPVLCGKMSVKTECVYLLLLFADEKNPLSLKPNPDNFADNVNVSHVSFS